MNNQTLLSQSLLQSSDPSTIITLEEVTELYENMRKETILKQYCDTSKIKERKAGKYTQFYILIEGKQHSAKARRELIDKLFELYCGNSVMTLEQAYTDWMLWRASVNTSSKTLKENKCEWNGYIKDTKLSQMQVAQIEISDFEDFLYDITKDYAITSKRLSNIISVLNGIMRRCVSNKIIPHNLLADIDKTIFHNRCKPANSIKDNYSAEERQRILDYLQDKTDAYALAIRFAFYLPLRFSETAAIKYSDIKDGKLRIQRAQRTCQKMNDDLTCFLQALFGQSCKTFLDIVACPNWTKLQSIWLALNRPAEQPCRHYELFTIRGTETVVLSLYPHVHVF